MKKKRKKYTYKINEWQRNEYYMHNIKYLKK